MIGDWAALVDGVVVNVAVEAFEAEALDVIVRHVEEVEHLELVGVEFDAERNGYFDICMFGEAAHGKGLRINDIVALIDHLKAA